MVDLTTCFRRANDLSTVYDHCDCSIMIAGTVYIKP